MFETAADEAIVELIKKLCKDTSGIFASEETRAKNIEHIAKLRASMNPTIECPK